MKSAAFAVLLGAAAVSASPSKTLRQPPSKRADMPQISVSGNAFWAGDQRFYVRGIDYQPGGAAGNKDPLADTDVCMRDIAKFRELGVNSVRVYMVDNALDHDECMEALADAGIYLLLDVNTPRYSINRGNPGPSYNAQYLQSVFATVDAFVKYDNLMLFFSGNEVINDEEDTDKSAPYIKAVTRDIKNYMRSRGHRTVPVGYSAADVSQNRLQTANYMNCGSDDARSDFFAFNDYSWCNTNFQRAGWDEKVETFRDYGLPIFLSEWGCIENGRDFNELSALMDPELMTEVYSGGLLYEYSLEPNEFGIVEIEGDEVRELEGFPKFASALSAFPAPSGDGGAVSTTHSVTCPTRDPEVWDVDPSAIPLMPVEAQAFMDDGAGEGPGLDGPGSQDAGGSGTSPGDTTGGTPSPTDDPDGAGRTVPDADLRLLVVSGVLATMTLFGALLL